MKSYKDKLTTSYLLNGFDRPYTLELSLLYKSTWSIFVVTYSFLLKHLRHTITKNKNKFNKNNGDERS